MIYSKSNRYKINKTISLGVFLFLQLLCFAQHEIKGKVIDIENGIPLPDTHLISVKDSAVVITDKNGEFTLSDKGEYLVSRIGYQNKQLILDGSDYIIIQLHIAYAQLNEIIINTELIPNSLKKATSTIAMVSKSDINRNNNLNFNHVLNTVPGMYMQTGALNTNRITIRGIGSRNLYGTAKIRAYFQDIPLTTGNGETSLEEYELASVTRIEILKGGGTSIYGAGLGGVIRLLPQRSYLNTSSVNSRFSVGSFGTGKSVINVNLGSIKNSVRAIYSHTNSNGFRENNNYNRHTFTLTSDHHINANNELSILGSLVDMKAYIPSSIDRQTYLNNPEAAAFTWKRSKGNEDMNKGILGLSWNHRYQEKLEHITSIFTSFRAGYEPRPFNILDENTYTLGLRSRLLGSVKGWKWTLGTELFSDRYLYRTYENLYTEYPAGTGSIPGNKLSDLKENRRYINLFFDTNFDISSKTLLNLGVNFNRTTYKLTDRFTTSNGIDLSGRYEFKGVLSPKIGLSHEINDEIVVYGNIGHGFSPPTLSETLLPDGRINTEIQPEIGWSFELGSRGKLRKSKLQYTLALYQMEIKDLLVARRTAADEFIGVNAGRTSHKGMELSLHYQWIDKSTFMLASYLQGTLNDFRFKEFIDNTNDYSGNQLTGVPSEILNAGIEITIKQGVYGTLNYQYIGPYPMNDSNSLFTENYNLMHAKLGYKLLIGEKFTCNLYAGINNIFNEKYASQVLINAQGFGGNEPRYYYPGNPVNYYTGVEINYTF